MNISSIIVHAYPQESVVLRALGDRDCMPKCWSNPLSQVKYI